MNFVNDVDPPFWTPFLDPLSGPPSGPLSGPLSGPRKKGGKGSKITNEINEQLIYSFDRTILNYLRFIIQLKKECTPVYTES